MFYPVLSRLKGYKGLTANDLLIYDKLLFEIYKSVGNKRFSPRISRNLSMEMDENRWETLLFGLVKEGFVDLHYEITCPNCWNSVKSYGNELDVPYGEYYDCQICGQEFEIEGDLIYVTFSLRDNFYPEGGDEAKADFFPKNHKGVKDYLFSELLSQHPEELYDVLVNKNEDELKSLLDDVENSETADQKKKSLEDLSEKLFESPYLILSRRDNRTNTGEIDRVFEVKRVPGTIFEDFSSILHIECKNWNEPMPAKEVESFIGKVRNARTKVGIIVSKKGVTGGNGSEKNAHRMIEDLWKVDGILLPVFDYNELKAIVDKRENVYTLLKKKITDLRLN